MTQPAPFLFSTMITYTRTGGKKSTVAGVVRALTEACAIKQLEATLRKNPQRRIVRIMNTRATMFWDDSEWMKRKGYDA